MGHCCDLLIIGGGPAGLSAAINAASEGLSVRLLDAGYTLGGQAKESYGIENYPGFPESITGIELMSRLVVQATKFGTKFHCPVSVQKLEFDSSSKKFVVSTDDYQVFMGKSVLIATGVQYRRLEAQGLDHSLGRGCNYGLPSGAIPRSKPCNVAVVGGANSAGQAVVRLASNAKSRIQIYVRKTLDAQMSTYLIDKIKSLKNVEICEGCEILEVYQHMGWLHSAKISTPQGEIIRPMDHMFVFIGALAKTFWLNGTVMLDKNKFVETASDYATSLPGVFAAGDVRDKSIKRIAAGVGEGSAAVPFIHRYLATV